MKNYSITIKEIKIKEYEIEAQDKDEAFSNIMEFYMYEDDSEDNKTIVEVEITEEK